MQSESQRHYTPLLGFLLLTCIVRFWLFLLPESFWLDESVTAFVIHHGAGHPSLAAGPKLDQTIYYWLPRASQALLGFSEFSLRLPSFLVTIVSLFLIGRLAVRLIHRQAAWVAIFLCFIPREFTRQATDARPYGAGTCVALCAMWFLIRWLDENKLQYAAGLAVFAALLLRIHLIYWPFYAVFAYYALMRRVRKETTVSGRSMAAIFAIVAASLVPFIGATMSLFRHASVHVVTELPRLNDILGGFQIPMIAAAGVGSWLAGRTFRWPRERLSVTPAGLVLLLSWWLWEPACLLAFSWITGNSVFLPRYFSLAMPGMILMGTLAAGYSIPSGAWKPVAVALALGILAVGFWKQPFPPTRNSHWREAALAVNDLVGKSATPVICPSPFIEAQPPVWTPAYALPSFLYAHLSAYPINATTILLPARRSPEGERYATAMIEERIASVPRFIIYGGIYSVNLWEGWLAEQPQLKGWMHRQTGSFGDVAVVLFQRRNS
jgi:4-amino-4-deoxy-L-arabinose transferase-like glycosyltransferase